MILALPSREYYLKGSSKSDLMAYHNYMTKIAIILGANPATVADDMQEVLDFEMQLANVSATIISNLCSFFDPHCNGFQFIGLIIRDWASWYQLSIP